MAMSHPIPREAEQRRGERNAGLLQERGAEPGPAFTVLLHTRSRAPSFQRLWAPQLPLTSPGRGDPSLFPSSGTCPSSLSIPVPPSVAEHQFPSLRAQGIPPSQPEESCTNHLHCRAAPHWAHERHLCWGSCPLPAASSGFPLCLPRGTTSPRALLTMQPLQTVAATPAARPWGGGQGLSCSSQDIKLLDCRNRGSRAGGTGNVSQGAWFLPPWQKESQGKHSWSQSRGHMQDPHPGTDDPPALQRPPPEGPEVLQEGEAPL